MKYAIIGLLLILLAVVAYIAYTQYAAGLYYLAGQYDRMMNPYGVDPDAPEPTEENRALHDSLFLVDLHADTLKWERDMLEREYYGHTDIPRMAAGNTSLQVFTIVTRSPLRWPWSDCVSRRGLDTNTLLFFMQGRPVFSIRDRAFYQIERFKEAAARSVGHPGPELRHIQTADDLEQLIEDRAAGKQVIGGIIGIEGGHWIGGPGASDADVEASMEELYDAGVRLFAPVHRFDNSLAGSNEGCTRYGLTDHGRIAVERAEALGMTIDLAHISEAALNDTLDLVETPVTVSHTGVRAGCEEPCRPDRNLSDEQIDRLIDNDGVIGVGYWPQAIGPSAWRIADAMEYIMFRAEEKEVDDPSRYVALGSDYDGSVTPLIEAGRLDVLTAIMRQRPGPFGPETIRNIAGLNACRLFGTALPAGDPERAERICERARDLKRLEPPE